MINLESINNAISKSIEMYKKETNVPNPICATVSIEKKGPEPIMYVRIEQKTLTSSIFRSYDWTIDGETEIK